MADFTYTFDKPINATKLDREIRCLNIPTYKGFHTVGIKLKVVFSAEITQLDINALTTLVDSHNTADTMSYISGKIMKAREFGAGLIVEFGTRNIMAGLSTAQIASMMVKLNPIIAALNTGSLNVAVAVIDSLTADAILTTELIAEYRTKIVNFIATL